MPSQIPPADGPGTNVVALDPVAKRRPGRPRSIRRAPDPQEREQHRRVAERLRQHVEADPIVRVTSRAIDRTSTCALDETMLEVARTAAGLAWDRERAQVEGRREVVEKIASRRIDALGKLANLILERARLGGELEVDPQDARVRKVVDAFFREFGECACETLDPQTAAKFISTFEEKIAGWEDRITGL